MALTVASNPNFTLQGTENGYNSLMTSADYYSGRLTASNRVAGYLTPIFAHPRPDSETNSYAVCRNAYTGIPYRIPISIQGGAPPWMFTLVQGPSGMTVGQNYGDTDYGILEWSSPTGTSEEIIIKAVDQDLNIIKMTWTVTIGTSAFIFADSVSGTSGGTGAIGDPIDSLDSIFVDADTTAKHANKIIILRSGATTSTYATPTYQCRLGQTVGKPIAIIGHYGDATQPTIDMADGATTQKYIVGFADDWAVMNCILKDSPGDNSGVKDSRFVSVSQQTNRFLVFENNGDNQQSGDSVTYPSTVGNDNPSLLTTLDPGGSSFHDYGVIAYNTLDDFAAGIYGAFKLRYGVIDFNTLSNNKATMSTNAPYGIKIKSDCQYVSARFNVGMTDMTNLTEGIIHSHGQHANVDYDYIEMWFNKMVKTNDVNHAFRDFYHGTSPATASNIYVVRNTIYGPVGSLDKNYHGRWVKNIVVTDAGGVPATGVERTITATDNKEYATAANPLDGNYDVPVSETTIYGTHGATIV